MTTHRGGTTAAEAPSKDIVVLVLGLLAIIFCVVGAAGSAAFTPKVVEWFQADASWRPVTIRIMSGELQHSRTRSGAAVMRPWFQFVVEGEERARAGYDLMGGYSSDGEWARGVLDRFPPGARVSGLVHPRDPERVILERGPVFAVALGLVPPFLLLLGVSFGSASLLRFVYLRRGRPRDGVFALILATGRVLQRESVLKALFYAGFAVVIGGVLWVGIAEANWLLIGVAAFFVYGVWRATRRPRR